ncbi:hypothetical protein [Pontibacter rugosus]|uniref:Uncharacterized protein n=1 Tax=Pontibacter rugosus TaxID=1745966 RepID=A0ABW3SUH5_9BACT
MNKAILVAISSIIFSIQAPVVYAQITANTLALHYVEFNNPASKKTTTTASKEEAVPALEEAATQEASDTTEQVSNKSMSEELTAWVQQEQAQPKRRLYRLR